MSTKRSIPAPNWTGVPNLLLDNLEDFPESELKVLLAAIREIIGWHKTKPQPMSISWFVKKTGLSKSAVEAGVTAAVSRGWLLECGTGKRGVKLYDINIEAPDYPDEKDSDDDYPDKKDSTDPNKRIVPSRSSGRLKESDSPKKSSSKKQEGTDVPTPDENKALADLIQSWKDAVKGKVPGDPFANKTIRAGALQLHRDGVLPADISAYVPEVKSDSWWDGKLVGFDYVVKNIRTWIADGRPPLSKKKVTNGAAPRQPAPVGTRSIETLQKELAALRPYSPDWKLVKAELEARQNAAAQQ